MSAQSAPDATRGRCPACLRVFPLLRRKGRYLPRHTDGTPERRLCAGSMKRAA